MIIESYKKGNVQFVHEYGQVFIDILQDIDIMLGTNKNFMLGPWLQSAKNLATTADEKINYEFNARNRYLIIVIHVQYCSLVFININPAS